MKIKKMSFADIEDTMCKEEMKCIMGGSGGLVTNGDYLGGSLAYGGSNPPAYSGPGGYYSNIGGWSNGFMNPSSGSSSSSSGGTGTSSPLGLTAGWVSTNVGIKTTDPVLIDRFITYMDKNNGVLTGMQITAFIMNEGTTAGQQQNSIQLYGTILNNVTVYNNYKGPSTIAPGMSYNDGILDINSSAYGGTNMSGGVVTGSTFVTSVNSSPTSAKLTNFTPEDIYYGFRAIDYSSIERQRTIPYNSITGQYDYNKTFQPLMKLNGDGAIAIAQYENLSLTVYDKDSNNGQNATIGFGHLLHTGAIRVGDLQSITFDKAISFLAKDIVNAENTLNQKIENMGLTGSFNRNQYLALVDMTFNGGNVVDTVLSAMKTGGVQAANSAFTNSYLNEVNGGVKDRRYFEAQAFIAGRSLTPEQANAELVSLGLKK